MYGWAAAKNDMVPIVNAYEKFRQNLFNFIARGNIDARFQWDNIFLAGGAVLFALQVIDATSQDLNEWFQHQCAQVPFW